uniref:FAST kinase domain-containing protein 4 n=1 Tax=Chrysolophus pictus TaxID=9089 RepID=A0A8C3LTP0_CHRPC
MAARLVQRCCWRHLITFACAPAAAPATLLLPNGKLPAARALPHTPLASIHISVPSAWNADRFSVKEQVEENSNSEHRVILNLIEAATSPQELLQLGELHSLNSNQASLVITRLSRLAVEKNLETGGILQDERFQQLIEIVDSQISQVWNNTLVGLLKSLYSLGMESSSREMQSVEHEVLWRLRRLAFRQLASLAEFLAVKQSKESKLLNEVIKKLELRWTELEGTRTVVMLIAKVGHISSVLMDRLEDKVWLSIAHLCSIILSFARLNFQPSGSEDFFNMAHEELQGQLDSLEPQLLTDLVWSLCVLQQAKPPYLQHVLAPDFHAVIQGDLSPRAQNLRMKLVQINAAAKLESPEYQGPFLPAGMLSAAEPAAEKVTLLQSSLREALAGVLGSQDNGRWDVHTIYGWQIDAEMVLNSENKPLPLKDFAAPHLPHSEGTKPLPPGARRIAFLRWEFPNFSNRSKELLGRYAMARRHIQAAGFLVVDVPHYEFLELKLERQRTAYLRDKLHKVVAKELAS